MSVENKQAIYIATITYQMITLRKYVNKTKATIVGTGIYATQLNTCETRFFFIVLANGHSDQMIKTIMSWMRKGKTEIETIYELGRIEK